MLVFILPSLLVALLLGPRAVLGQSGQSGQSSANISITDLPSCVLECGITTLTQFQCLPQDPCYCNDVQLSSALTACVRTICPFADQLTAGKYRANVCSQPVRNRSHYTRHAAPILFTLAMGFIIARLLSRSLALSGAGYKADDYIIMLLVIPTIGMFVVSNYTVRNGSGQDVWMLTPNEIKTYLKWFLAGQVTLFMVIFGTKLSLVLLYLRIWPAYLDGRSWFHYTCYVIAATLSVAAVVSCTITVLACRPIAAYWTLALRPQAKCLNSTQIHYGFASLNLVLDIAVLSLPISRILKLRVSVPRKLGLLATFTIGFVVTACSALRLYLLKQTENTQNPTYDFSPAGLLGVVELNASVITCCMPATAGLARRCWSKGVQPILTSLRSQSAHDGRGGSDATASTEATYTTFDTEKTAYDFTMTEHSRSRDEEQ